ncbi:hypothetical protein LEP1GSC050_2275 [Leptospira broomii serovar Hurstbridge str. 5399]|uniref:Uncharacterized protein n=1 Tax=Leptospira broomii serovar Hurstbridge str. 5399 TaxID=1049789 RepID=T0FBY2_9LEPT|nr:hypothetical protein LEP1GSC050_2275 [Leptospira broomii serovar Hurstbridge str. 5399]
MNKYPKLKEQTYSYRQKTDKQAILKNALNGRSILARNGGSIEDSYFSEKFVYSNDM